MKKMKKFLVLALCFVMVLAMTACGSKPAEESGDTAAFPADGSVVGEGAKSFTLEVVDKEGNKTTYTINTDEKTVGAALLGLKLLEGEDGDYGLYVKSVLGMPLDFEKDGMYWAFYIDGEYGMTGLDMTDIVPGTVYTLKAEK